MTDPLVQILVAVLPAVVVFLTAFYLLRQVMTDRAAERSAAFRKEDHRQTLPLRLQAYERLALFLERIEPGPLVLRVHKSSMGAETLYEALVSTVREEFEHNVTQQVYVSDKLWSAVRQAKEETIRLVNISFEQVGGKGAGTDLSRRVFENASRLSHTPSQEAMMRLKDEVRRLF
jgi:predicted AlkP superfamily phosphohydrolase/phosphomutase